MLNVTVSRAKDSFMVFGDMRIFNIKSVSPSGLLARMMFAKETNEIKNLRPITQALYVVENQKSNKTDKPKRISKTEEHQQILKECLEKSEKKIVIISPYISSLAIETDELIKIISAAVNRKVEVIIYTDKYLNTQNGKPKLLFTKGVEQLKKAGAVVIIAERIHNKTLWVDDKILIEGSFNWLSARRTPDDPWCRYEASILYQGVGVDKMIKDIEYDMQNRIEEQQPVKTNKQYVK